MDYCTRCGCLIGKPYPLFLEADPVCGPCFWDLRAGDLVVCTDQTNHCYTLRVAQLYEVERVQREDGRALIFLMGTGMAWPWYQFRFVARRTGKWPWAGKNGAAGDGIG